MRRFRYRVMVLAIMLLAVCAEAWADVEINAANFPDEAFRNYVSDRCDTDKNGSLSDSEISSVLGIYSFTLGSISSLKGIEYFTSIQILRCEGNHLTELDVSKNTALSKINCADNKFTTLNLSKNILLMELICDFTITDEGNRFSFNIVDFMNAYKLDKDVLYVNFRYHYGNSGRNGTMTLDKDTINSNNVVSFTIPAGETFNHISMTLTYSNSSNKNVIVYPFSASSSATTLIAPVITTASLPDGTLETAYTQTLTALGDIPITWTLASGDLPDGLTLTSSGTISGTPAKAGAFTFSVKAQNSSGSDEKLFTILVPMSDVRPPSFIVATALPDGFTDTPYGFQLTASGSKPLTWSLAEGSTLPEGLTLTTRGYLYGTPAEAGDFVFSVNAANSAGTVLQNLALKISEAPASKTPLITTSVPEPAEKGQPYICQLAASGTPPFTWTVKEKFPVGLTMNSSGLITGTPTKTASKKLTLTVANAYGTDKKKLTLTVYGPPEITTASLKDAKVGKKYSTTLKSKGTKPLEWEIEGDLPQGITFDASKDRLSGTPTVNDAGVIRVTLKNPAGEVSKVLTLKVKATAPKISTKSLKAGTWGKSYKASISVKGTKPITLYLSGELPAGMTFNTSTGKIEGTPTEVCTDRALTLIAANIGGVASVDYKLTVKAVAPKITTKSLPDAAEGSEYSASLEAESTPSITWSATGLPEGLSISEAGEISGTPAKAGKYTVKVTATNAAKSVKKTLKLKVSTSASTSSFTVYEDNLPAQERYAHGDNAGNSAKVYVIVAELPEVSVDVAGMYDFDVVLSEDVEAGAELLYLAGSSEPSDDDEIAEFADSNGEETEVVPEDRRFTLSVWLNPGRMYKPSIAIKR